MTLPNDRRFSRRGLLQAGGIGALGLAWPGLVSGTAEGLAKAAISLYSDEARWNQAQRDARQVLERHFNPQWHGAALVQRIQQTLMGLADQRLYNFTGAMLRRSR